MFSGRVVIRFIDPEPSIDLISYIDCPTTPISSGFSRFCLKIPSLQCRRFLRARECFAGESAMLKLKREENMGALAPAARVTIFTLPNPLS